MKIEDRILLSDTDRYKLKGKSNPQYILTSAYEKLPKATDFYVAEHFAIEQYRQGFMGLGYLLREEIIYEDTNIGDHLLLHYNKMEPKYARFFIRLLSTTPFKIKADENTFKNVIFNAQCFGSTEIWPGNKYKAYPFELISKEEAIGATYIDFVPTSEGK